jgi:hypothetical protein
VRAWLLRLCVQEKTTNRYQIAYNGVVQTIIQTNNITNYWLFASGLNPKVVTEIVSVRGPPPLRVQHARTLLPSRHALPSFHCLW